MVPKNCDDGVNVGILDNDACALEMMRLLLQRSGSSMHVVWTGMTAQRTLERVTFEQSADSLSKANVLVMNLALNGISGVDVYRQIRCRNASLGIVGVNSYPLDQYRQQLASAGAQGLFSRRDIFSPAFAKAIREVASGKRADCPGDFLSARESYEHLRIVSEKDERIISKRELNILSMYKKTCSGVFVRRWRAHDFGLCRKSRIVRSKFQDREAASHFGRSAHAHRKPYRNHQ